MRATPRNSQTTRNRISEESRERHLKVSIHTPDFATTSEAPLWDITTIGAPPLEGGTVNLSMHNAVKVGHDG